MRDRGIDAEWQRLRRLDDSPIGRERLQRVEIWRARVGVLRRHCTATDVPLRHDDRLPEAHATAEPRVLLVLTEAVDAEVHAEAPLVDLGLTEDAGEGVQGAGAEQRRGAAAPAVRRGPRATHEPKIAAGEVGERLAPRPVDDTDLDDVPPEARAERAVEADFLRDGRAVGELERQRARLAVVPRNDLLENAEALAVHEAVVLVDEEELPVARDPGLGQVALVELPNGQALDRGVRDPGDAQAHTLKSTGRVRPAHERQQHLDRRMGSWRGLVRRR